MKQSKDYTLLALFIPFAIATFFSGAFAGCNNKETPARLNTLNATENKAMQMVDARDYQIDIVEDSILVFDGNRYVGTIPCNFEKPTPLDSLLLIDNE